MAELGSIGSTLDEVLLRHVSDDGPGAVVAVSQGGATVAHAARGMASLEHRRPVTADTVFDIASVSKQMTSAVALLLERRGLFDLDADIRELVPELDIGRCATFRDCLHHVAGLPDYLTMCEVRGDYLGVLSGDEGFVRVLREMGEATFEPRTRVQYSNTGYVLTALAIHRATGRRLDEHMARLVFGPLSMRRSQVRSGPGLVMTDMAFSYSHDRDGQLWREEMPLVQFGDGAVQTTIDDLSRWHGFLQDGRVLGADIRDELAVPAVLADGRSTRYGLGLMLGRCGGSMTLQHSGGMYGYRSYLVSVPQAQVGVTVLANSDTTATRKVAWEVLGAVLGEPVAPSSGSPPDLAGPWYSANDHHLFDLEHSAEGGLRYTDAYGMHDLAEDEVNVWRDRSQYVTVRPADGSLDREDRLGDRSEFVRLDPTVSPCPPREGCYDCSLERAQVVVAMRGDDVELTCGTSQPQLLQWRGRSGSAMVYSSGTVTLVRRAEASDRFTLSIEDLQLTCRAAPN